MSTLDFSLLKPIPSSSIVGLSTTANSTPAYIIPNTPASSFQQPAQTPAASIYSTAPSTVVKSSPSAVASPTGAGLSYTIKSGDTLAAIAARYGTTVSALAAANGITNPNLIIAGKPLNIPSAAPVNAQTPASTAPTNETLPAGQFKTPSGAIVDANGQIVKPAPVAGAPVTPDASALAKAAGEAGLSVSDYESLLGGNTAVSSAEHKAIATELGISDAEAAAFAKPKETTQAVYDHAYSSAGLDQLHAKIVSLIDSINAKKQTASDAIGTVNENPFLDEKSRVGRGKRVLDQANAEIQNEVDLLTQMQGLYTQGVTEVNNLVARTSADFKDNQTQAQAYLNYLQTKAQQKADQLKSDKTIIASNTVTDYLKGRAKATAAAAKAKAPDLVGSATTGYFRWDAGTMSFVPVIKGTGGSGGSTTFKPTSAQKASVGQFLNTSAGKELTGGVAVTSADLDELFGDQTTFYALLQQANDAGY